MFTSSRSSLRRKREKWGMLNTRQQKHTFETIAPFIKETKDHFPNMGAHQLVTILRQNYQLKVSEYVQYCFLICVYSFLFRKMVLDYLNWTEREAMKFHKQK